MNAQEKCPALGSNTGDITLSILSDDVDRRQHYEAAGAQASLIGERLRRGIITTAEAVEALRELTRWIRRREAKHV